MLKIVPHMGNPIVFVAQNGTAPTAVQSSLGLPGAKTAKTERQE
jgi:hypothetical protein